MRVVGIKVSGGYWLRCFGTTQSFVGGPLRTFALPPFVHHFLLFTTFFPSTTCLGVAWKVVNMLGCRNPAWGPSGISCGVGPGG